eukprot:1142338-Pelagomonas_calceolata.AAC.9
MEREDSVAPEASEALKILQTIKRDLFTSRCVVGSGGKSVGCKRLLPHVQPHRQKGGGGKCAMKSRSTTVASLAASSP